MHFFRILPRMLKSYFSSPVISDIPRNQKWCILQFWNKRTCYTINGGNNTASRICWCTISGNNYCLQTDRFYTVFSMGSSIFYTNCLDWIMRWGLRPPLPFLSKKKDRQRWSAEALHLSVGGLWVVVRGWAPRTPYTNGTTRWRLPFCVNSNSIADASLRAVVQSYQDLLT